MNLKNWELRSPEFRGRSSLRSACNSAARLYGTRRMHCLRLRYPVFRAAMLACCRLRAGCCQEVRHKGDWSVKVPHVEPGGWYFEFNNEFYPDVDDSAQVLLALSKVENPRERYQYDVTQRAIRWIWGMQCKNGGWASFDKDNTKMIFQHIPFADHNAMLDPPTVDITGRILEMLAS